MSAPRRYFYLLVSCICMSVCTHLSAQCVVLPIVGNSSGCVYSTINLSDLTPGGTWSSSNTTIATVDPSTGVVTLVKAGSVTITYTVGSCSVTKTITVNSVILHPNVIECNNGITHFNSSDTYYGVTYSNSNAGNLFNWSITGGTFNYQGSSSASSQYPNVQLQNGSAFTVIMQFTTNGVTCSDTQMVYKNATVTDAITNSHDTTVCFNTAPINLSGTASAVADTYSWTTGGSGTFSSPSSLTTTYTPSAADKAAGTIKLYLAASASVNVNGNCGTSSAKDSMILRIYPDNTGTNSTQTICSNQSLSYTPVSVISGSTFSWSSAVSSGSVAGNSATGTGNITDSLVNLSSTVNGVVVYTITPYAFTPTNKSCTGTPFTLTVNVGPAPAITITNSSTSLCNGTATNIQFSSSLAGSTYTWSSSVVSGSAGGNSSNGTYSSTNKITDLLTNATTANATVRYVITAKSTAGCTKKDSTTVLVFSTPSVSSAGSDISLCNGSSTALSGNTPMSGSGTWVQVSGPSTVSFANAASPVSTVSGLVPGTYLLSWVVTNGSCAVSPDTVTLTNYPPTVPGTVSSSTAVCTGTNSGTLTLGGYTGSILRWEASTDGGSTWPVTISNTTNSFSFSNLTATTLYRAVVQNGNCAVNNATPATITVNAQTNAGVLSGAATVCTASNSGTISLSGYTGNILRWESSTDGGTSWSNIANTTTSYSYTNLTVTTQYRAVVQNGVCGALNSNAVTITVSPATVPGTLSGAATVCAGTNSGNINLAGNTGTVVRWEFSTDNGASWTNISNTTGTLSYSNLTATTKYRALVQSGACNSVYTNVITITVLQAVTTADAGVDQALCNLSSATLAGNTPTSGTGSWTAAPGNPSAVTFANAANPATTVNGLVPGTYQFTWTITNGTCADSWDIVQVTVYPAAVPGTVGASTTVCAAGNSGTLNLTGYSGNIVRWEYSTDNGSSWNNIVNSSSSLNYSNLTTTTQYRAAVQVGSCSIVYSNVATITVLPAVSTANAGADQQLCNVSAATMAAVPPSSGTGSWSAAPGNPTTVTFVNAASATTIVNGLTAGTYQFIWTVTNGVCTDSQDMVEVTIYPATVAGTASADATVCATANSGTINLTGFVSNILRWESSTDNGSTWNNIANTTALVNYANLSATTFYRAYVQNAICPAQYSNAVHITVLQAVSSSDAGPDQALCNVTSATMAAVAPSSGTGTWTAVPGNPTSVTFTNPVNPGTTVNGLTAGTYQFKWTVSNGVCADSWDIMQVTVSPATIPGTIAANATVCATANSGTLSLTGNTGNILQWESSIDNGATWSTIINTTGSLNFSNLSSTTIYRASVQSGSCPAQYTNNATITVLQPVTIANAGTDQALCNVTSATLAGNTPTSGTGTWTAMPGNPTSVTFTNAVNPGTTVNGLTAGTYQFKWTVSNGVCSDSWDIVQVTVSPATIPGTVAANTTVCATANSGSLSLTGNTGNILQWESSVDNGATWSTIINTTSVVNYSNLSVTTIYRASVQSGSCPAQYTNNGIITVVQAVTAANAGPDQALCNVTSATMAGNSPTSGTGTWTAMPGNPTSVTFTNAVDPGTTVNGLTAGTYQFKWTISNGICTGSSDIMEVIVSPATIPGTVAANATVCATANSGTLSLTGNTGNILQWESSIDNGATWSTIINTTSVVNYSNLSSTTIYRASVQSGSCPALYTNNATITVLQPVTTANAGADQALCNVTSATLAGNTPGSGTGTWTAMPGNPTSVTFTNPVNPATTVNGLTAGTYQFKWTVSNGVCADSWDIMQVTVSPATIPGTIAANATVCATANSGSLSLTGNTGNILQWESSIDNGATWSTIINTTGSLNFSNLSSTTIYRASVQSGSCPAQYTNNATITVLQPVTIANAGPDQALCNVTSATLAGNTPTSGTGTWTAMPGNPTSVTFTNAVNPGTTVNGLTAGTYQFKWTVSNGVCSDSWDIVQVTVSSATTPGTIAANATVCATANSGSLSLTGNAGNILQWESSIDNGATWSTIINTTALLNFSNLSATTIFRASVKSGNCSAQYTNNATITVLQAVTTANAGVDQALCNVTSATLAGNTPTSGTGTWTAMPGNPTSVTFTNAVNPNTTVSGLTAGTYQFKWTVSNGVCSDSWDVVQVIVYPATNPGTLSADVTVCATANSGTLSLTGNNGNILQWESSTNNGTSWNTIINTTGVLNFSNLSSTTIYRASVQNAVCPALYSNVVNVTVMQPVTTADAGPDVTIINGITSYKLGGNIPTSGTGTWTVVQNGPTTPTFSNIHDALATVGNLDYNVGPPPTNGIYKLMWTVSNGYCASSSDVMQITVEPPTNPGRIGPDAVVCVGFNHGTLTLTDYLGTILQWESSTDYGAHWTVIASTVGQNQASYTYDNLTTTTLFRALVKNGVGEELYSGIAATVTVLELVTPSNAGPDQTLCNTTTATLAGNTPTSGTGTWSAEPGNPTAVTFSNTADPAAVVNGLTYGTYKFAWTIANGFCSDSKTVVTITVLEPTIPGVIAADATVCAGSNSGTLNISGYRGSILEGQISTDGGSTWSGIANTNGLTSFTYTNLSSTSQFRASVQNGVCPALLTNVVTITTLSAVTIADAGPDQVLCSVSGVTLAGNTPTSGTGTWTAVAGNPSPVTFTNANDPQTTVTGLTNGVYRFAWTISNTLCTASQDIVTITVSEVTLPGSVATDATVCAGGNSGTLSLTGYRSSVLRWETSTDNGTTWNNLANTTDVQAYNNLNATTSYRALVQNSVCPSLYSNMVTITVVQPVTAANAGSDQQLCNVSGATLAGNTPASGTGLWTAVAGNPSSVSFTNPNDPNTTVNGLVAGTYQFAWTISNALCASSSDLVSITVYQPTLAGTVALDATVCATANSGTLSLTGYRSSVLRWETSTDNGTTWNNLANTTDAQAYNNLNATTSYRALVQNSVCPSLYSNMVTITVVQPVTAANAGSDQQLCNVSGTTLAGNTPASGTGLWTAVAGNPSSVSFTNPNDPNTTVNGLVAGTYQFAWTISNALCASSSDLVSITVYQPTLAGTVALDATVCTTANSGTLSLTGYRSSVLRWESSTDNGTTWNNLANTTDAQAYNNLHGTTRYRAYVQNAICPALYSNNVTITVLPEVTTANAGSDQQLCNSSGTTLAGNTPTSGTGLWTAVAGNPSSVAFTNPNDPNTTVTGLVAGTYQFAWTISNALCASSSDLVSVTVYEPTLAGTLTLDATVCTTANSGTLSLTGYRSSVLRWETSTDNGTTWNNLANTSDVQAYNNLHATTQYRAYVQNAVCPALYSNNVTITVLPEVTPANAGSDQQLCNVSGTTLAGNTPASGTGLWTAVAGNPSIISFTNPNDPNTTVNGLVAGTYQFAWTISNALCASSSDLVSVTVYEPTLAGTLALDATVCATANSGTLSLTGYRSSVLRWETSGDNGTTWNNLANTTGVQQYNNLNATTLYRTYAQNAICPALYSNNVTITVWQPVTQANAGNDQQLCNASGTTLAGNTPASGTGLWTAMAGNPSSVSFTNPNDPNTTVNGLTAGTYQFTWTISNGTCADSRDDVSITVYAPTLPGTLAADVAVCATANSGRLLLSGYRGGILRWETSGDNGSTWNNVGNITDSLVFNNLTTTGAYRAYVQNAICPAMYSNLVTITVLQPVTPANAGSDQQLCSVSGTTLAANTPASGTGLWTAVAGNPSAAGITNPADPNTTVTGLTTGTYYFAWTISNGLCASSSDTVAVTIYAPTLAGTLALDATVCAVGNAGRLGLTAYRSSVLRWETSTDNGSSWNNVANTTDSLLYNNLNATSAYRAYVQNAVCPALYSNSVTITVMQPVTIAAAGPDQSLCNTTTAALAGNTPTSGTGTWTVVAGSPSAVSFNNAADPNTTVTGLTTGTYQFVWTISNGSCADSRDTMAITVYAATAAGTLVADAFVCASGNAGTVRLSGYTGRIIHWEFSVDSGANWSIVNNVSDSFVYQALSTTTQYRALVQNGPCNSIYSNLVTITVNPATAPGKLSAANTVVCSAYNSGSLLLAGYTGSILRWESSADSGRSWSAINQSGPVYSYSNLTSATWLRVLVQSGVCATGYSDTVRIAVDANTVAGTLAGSATVCAGGNNGTLVLSGSTGHVIHWESSVDNGVSWTILPDTAKTFAYNGLTTTTSYRALVQNGVCAVQYSNTIVVTVTQPVTVANAGPDQLLCSADSSTVLSANAALSGTGVWTMVKGDNAVQFTDATAAVTRVYGLKAGRYQFAWTISNGICAASTSLVNVVVDKIAPSFTLAGRNECGQTIYQFADTSTSHFGIRSVRWSVTPGDTATGNRYTHIFTKEANYNIAHLALSNSGCVSNSGADFAVKVFEFPHADINAVSEACKKQLLQLTPGVNSRDSIAYLLWNLGNGQKLKDSLIEVQYYEEGTYSIKLVVSTVNQCFDSVYKQIVIHPAPVLTLKAEQNLCKGDSLTLQAGGAAMYLWKDEAGNLICNNCATPIVKPVEDTHYDVVGVSEYGCSQLATTKIRVVQPFKMDASPEDSICLGTSRQIYASGAATYQWYPATGLSSANTAKTIAKPQATTTYHVLGKDSYQCFTDTAEIRIVVGEPTKIEIGHDTVMTAGTILKLKARPALQNIRKWAWSGISGLSCINCAEPEVRVSQDATISALAVNNYGCVSSDTMQVKTFCGSTELFVPNAFTPDGDGVNDVLVVQGKGVKLIKSFRIFSRWGELVFEKINFAPGDVSAGWDGKIRGVPASPDVFVYMCEVICEKGIPSMFKGNVAIIK